MLQHPKWQMSRYSHGACDFPSTCLAEFLQHEVKHMWQLHLHRSTIPFQLPEPQQQCKFIFHQACKFTTKCTKHFGRVWQCGNLFAKQSSDKLGCAMDSNPHLSKSNNLLLSHFVSWKMCFSVECSFIRKSKHILNTSVKKWLSRTNIVLIVLLIKMTFTCVSNYQISDMNV